jgi:hypothetical protein
MWAVLPTFQRCILPPSSGLDLNPENGDISEMSAVLPISIRCKDSRTECISIMKLLQCYTETCNKIYKIFLNFVKSFCSENLTIPCPTNILKMAIFWDTM